MVAHLVRLKLTLLRNGLKRSVWQIIGMVVGLLYGLGALALVVAGIVALAVAGSAELQRSVLVGGGSLLVLGWMTLPIIAFGVDATLDPARFVTFPISRRDLIAGLGLAGLVGIPGAATVIGVLVAAFVWWRTPVAVLAALVTGALAVATCVVGSRAATTGLAPVLTGRRAREVTGFGMLALLAAVYLGFGRLTTGGLGSEEQVVGALRSAADVLGWTPLGVAWSVPADVAAGAWGTAGVRLVILVATLALLLLAWDRALARAMVQAPRHDAGSPGNVRGLGWFARTPATPAGAVAARSLTYWFRDPRYAMAVAAVFLAPVAMWAFGMREQVLFFLPFLAVVTGWSISTDTSSDGTALWMHVATPLRGIDDRAGRAAAALLVLSPVVVVLTVFLAVVTGYADQLPALLGAALGAFLSALGVASVMSAAVVMRVQQAGENPFGVKQGSSVTTVLLQMGGMLSVGLLALPETGLAIASIVLPSAVLGWVALLVGLVLGALLLVIGARWGGHLYDRGAPKLLQRLVSLS